MHPFLRKILEATRLTRSGNLAEATAAIQRALSQQSQAGTHTRESDPGDVIEVEVIERPAASGTATDGPTLAGTVAELDPVARQEIGEVPVELAAQTRDARTEVEPDDGAVDAPTADRRPAGPGRFLASSFTGADGTRTFKLFVPDGFDGEALPLVVMLHGCTQDPDDFAAGTRMNELAQEEGVIVLYPAQAPRSNAHKCWNWFSPGDQRRGAGEPALLAGMTRHILQTHSIDQDRVYVAGLSAGGAMAAILAREYPDLFAAAGVHSGVAAGVASDVASAFAVMKSGPGGRSDLASLFAMNPSEPAQSAPGTGVPVIVFHGDADTTVAPANGDAVVGAILGDASAHVATTREAATASGARSFRHTVWRRNDDPTDGPSAAEHWVVRGSPHAWSGGAETGSYTDPAGPDASREMLRFFLEHPRRG